MASGVLGRLLIIVKWLFINMAVFSLFELISPPFVAATISFTFTVSLFFHADNIKEVNKLKRPVILVKG